MKLRLPRFLRGHRHEWTLRFAGRVDEKVCARLWLDRGSGGERFQLVIAGHGRSREIRFPELVGLTIIEDIDEGSGMVAVERSGEELLAHVAVGMMGASKTLEMDLHKAAAEMVTDLQERLAHV